MHACILIQPYTETPSFAFFSYFLATFLNFYVSHGSTGRFLRGGEKCYIYFADSLLLFVRVKEFSKLVNS